MIETIEVDVRKVIPETITRVVGENQELCSTCQGLGRVFKGNYIVNCSNCFNGIVKKCQYCGGKLHPYKSHTCEQMHQRWQEEQAKKALDKWAAAKKIPLEEALNSYKMLYSDLSDEYVSTDDFEDWLADYLEDSEGRLPLIFATKTTNLTLDADTVLQDQSDNLHEDALDNIYRNKIDELQNFLDKWCKDIEGHTLTYWPDYKVAVSLEGQNG